MQDDPSTYRVPILKLSDILGEDEPGAMEGTDSAVTGMSWHTVEPVVETASNTTVGAVKAAPTVPTPAYTQPPSQPLTNQFGGMPSPAPFIPPQPIYTPYQPVGTVPPSIPTPPATTPPALIPTPVPATQPVTNAPQLLVPTPTTSAPVVAPPTPPIPPRQEPAPLLQALQPVPAPVPTPPPMAPVIPSPTVAPPPIPAAPPVTNVVQQPIPNPTTSAPAAPPTTPILSQQELAPLLQALQPVPAPVAPVIPRPTVTPPTQTPAPTEVPAPTPVTQLTQPAPTTGAQNVRQMPDSTTPQPTPIIAKAAQQPAPNTPPLPPLPENGAASTIRPASPTAEAVFPSAPRNLPTATPPSMRPEQTPTASSQTGTKQDVPQAPSSDKGKRPWELRLPPKEVRKSKKDVDLFDIWARPPHTTPPAAPAENPVPTDRATAPGPEVPSTQSGAPLTVASTPTAPINTDTSNAEVERSADEHEVNELWAPLEKGKAAPIKPVMNHVVDVLSNLLSTDHPAETPPTAPTAKSVAPSAVGAVALPTDDRPVLGTLAKEPTQPETRAALPPSKEVPESVTLPVAAPLITDAPLISTPARPPTLATTEIAPPIPAAPPVTNVVQQPIPNPATIAPVAPPTPPVAPIIPSPTITPPTPAPTKEVFVAQSPKSIPEKSVPTIPREVPAIVKPPTNEAPTVNAAPTTSGVVEASSAALGAMLDALTLDAVPTSPTPQMPSQNTPLKKTEQSPTPTPSKAAAPSREISTAPAPHRNQPERPSTPEPTPVRPVTSIPTRTKETATKQDTKQTLPKTPEIRRVLEDIKVPSKDRSAPAPAVLARKTEEVAHKNETSKAVGEQDAKPKERIEVPVADLPTGTTAPKKGMQLSNLSALRERILQAGIGTSQEKTSAKTGAETPSRSPASSNIAALTEATKTLENEPALTQSSIAQKETIPLKQQVSVEALPLMRTFKQDVQQSVRHTQTSVVGMISANERKRAVGDVVIRKAQNSSWLTPGVLVLLLTSLALIVGAGVVGFIFFLPNNEPAQHVTFFEPDQKIELDTTEQDRTMHVEKLATTKDTIPVEDGHITHITISEQVVLPISGETETVPVSAKHLLRLWGVVLPDSLDRSITDSYMFGYIGRTTNEPFLVLESNYIDGALAGMLSWELRMSKDLDPIFPTEGYGLLENQETIGSTTPLFDTTSTTTPVAPIGLSMFEDTTVAGTPTRILRTPENRTLLVWCMSNKHIIITTNEESLQRLVERLQALTF